MSKRKYEKQGDLTNDGIRWGGYYYTNFPDDLKTLFPIYGTQDIETQNDNTLEIRQPMIAYMLRDKGWVNVPIDGWTELSTGQYLGPESGNITIYEKLLLAGTYTINNNASLYLFTKGNTYIEQYNF